MKPLELLFASHLWLASGAVALYLFFCLSAGLAMDTPIACYVFFSFNAIYNFHSKINVKRGRTYNACTVNFIQSKWGEGVLLTALIGVTLSILNMSLAPALAGVCFLLGGLAYALKWADPSRVRGLKPFAITLIVTLQLTSLTLLQNNISFEELPFMPLIFLLVHVFNNTLLGDIRDMYIDGVKKKSTLAREWGYRKTVSILLCINFGFMFFLFQQRGELTQGSFIAMLSAMVLTQVSLLWTRKKLEFRDYHFFDANHFTALVVLSFLMV